MKTVRKILFLPLLCLAVLFACREIELVVPTEYELLPGVPIDPDARPAGMYLLNEANMEEEVKTACGSDMMSDVLAFVKDQSVLLTGLMNTQVVRTAEMMDMHCIVFVRGKKIDPNVVALARQKEITVLASPYRMFTACGLLYSNGLRGGCEIQ